MCNTFSDTSVCSLSLSLFCRDNSIHFVSFEWNIKSMQMKLIARKCTPSHDESETISNLYSMQMNVSYLIISLTYYNRFTVQNILNYCTSPFELCLSVLFSFPENLTKSNETLNWISCSFRLIAKLSLLIGAKPVAQKWLFCFMVIWQWLWWVHILE